MSDNPHRWYAIHKAEDDSAAEVHLYDEIGAYGVGAKQFAADIKPFSGKRLHLRINSVGGSVTEGLAIANAIKRHKGGVTAHIDGLAASMASVIAVSASETIMADNGFLMIHEPWTVGMGTADDLRSEASVLDKMRKTILAAYAKKTGLPHDELESMMKAETWLTAEEARDSGFIDEIEDGIEAAASITRESARERYAKFQNSMHKTNAPAEPPKVDTEEEAMNAELQAKVEELQASLATATETAAADLAAFKAQADEDSAKERESLKAEVDRLTNEVATRDAEIAKLQAESKSAGEQAAAIVAAAGVNTEGVISNQPEPSAAEVFANLSGPEATHYFRAHKAAILASIKP
jgi:ATP-dependent Clp endopeptidase proteolytic subunit ClpP